MGAFGSKSLAYYGPDGNLLTYKMNSKHDGKKEFQFVSSHDGVLLPGEECYLIHSKWLDSWLSYVQATSRLPGFISNRELVNISGVEPNIVVSMKRDIKVKIDFRPIKKVVWQYLFGLYGGGPILVLFVPFDCTDKQYQSGTWVKQADFNALTNIVRKPNYYAILYSLDHAIIQLIIINIFVCFDADCSFLESETIQRETASTEYFRTDKRLKQGDNRRINATRFG